MRRLGQLIGWTVSLAAATAVGEPPAPGRDLYGDPVPAGAVRLGTTRLRHGHVISRVAFSPDGRILASIDAAQKRSDVCLWDAATGRLVRRLQAPGGIWDFAFLPGGRKLLTCGADRFHVWDLSTGKVARSVLQPDQHVRRLTVSPDGKSVLATVGVQRRSRLVDLATGKALVHLHDCEMGVFSPDGKTIAAAGPLHAELMSSKGISLDAKAHVQLYDVAEGRVLRKVEAGGLYPSPPAFSPDGKLLAWCAGPTRDRQSRIDVIEAATGKLVRTLSLPGSPGGLLVLVNTMGVVATVVFSPDGKLLAAPCIDGTIRLWDVAKGVEVRRITSWAKLLAFSPDARTLATAGTHVVEMWDLATGARRLADACNRRASASVGFSPDGRTVATACEDRAVHLWDRDTGRHSGKLTGHTSNLCSAEFSPDGRTMVSCAYDGTVRAWDGSSGRELHRLTLDKWWPNRAAFLAGGRRVCVAGHPGHVVWDAGTGRVERRWTGSPHGISAAAVAPHAELLVVANGDGRTIDLWAVAAGIRLYTLRTDGHGSAGGVCFAPSEDVLAYVTDQKLVLVETCSGKTVLAVDQPGEMRLCEETAAFSPDGRVIALVAPQHRIVLLRADDGEEIGRLRGHRAWIRSLAFSPDGRRLASTCNDTTALVWDVSKVRAALPPSGPFDPAGAERLWQDLRGNDATKAYQATWALVAAGEQAVGLLAPRLRPAPAPGPQRVAGLIRQLGADRYKARTEAFERLRVLGLPVEPDLREALGKTDSEEVRQRLRELLVEIPRQLVAPNEAVGAIRAVAVLERIGTPKALRVLQTLTQGAPGALLTRRARAALARAAQKEPSRP